MAAWSTGNHLTPSRQAVCIPLKVLYARDPPFLLNRLAAEKQLSAKACPCPVDKSQPNSNIRSTVLHTLLLGNCGIHANTIVYPATFSHTQKAYRPLSQNDNHRPTSRGPTTTMPMTINWRGLWKGFFIIMGLLVRLPGVRIRLDLLWSALK